MVGSGGLRTEFLIPLVAAAAVAADPLTDVHRELGDLEGVVTDLEQKSLAPELLERRHKLTARLSEGQLFFLTEDYDRAATVLLDVVEDPRARNHPAYRDALYYLAESLFRLRNYKAATSYYELVATHGVADQQQEALGRLLEIALQTEDHRAAQSYLARAEKLLSSSPDPRLLYSVGRYHYRTGDLDQAARMFQRIPAAHAESLRARYFLGVVQVKKGAFADALKTFEGIVETPLEGDLANDVSAKVVDQARLAIARVHYELSQFEQAVAAYALVPRDSAAFDEAMYESVWISVKQQAYEKALRRLEILLIGQTSALRGPDARLLKGKLLMMQERYDDASEAFQEVLFEFGPIQTEMQEVVDRNRGDLVGYFNRLIGRNIAEFDLASFLPARAAEFAGPDVAADRALLLVSDLAAQRRDIDDVRRALDRIQVAIDAPNRIEIFPRLHQGWLKAVESRARLTLLRGRLNDVAAQRAEAAAGHDELLAERKRWRERFDQMPHSVMALQARDAKVDDELAGLDEAVHRLTIDIHGLEAQLAAVRKYVEDTAREGGGMLPKDIAAMEQVQRELDEMKAIRAEVEALAKSLAEERIRVGVNDDASKRDDSVRGRYLAAVEAEARWLAQHGAPIPPAELRRLEALERRVEEFMRKAAGLVDERIAEIRRVVDREAQNVRGYEGELVTYRGETESLGGAIADRSFRHVLGRIDAVVLEADVGLVDVTWKQKEDRSKQISSILQRQGEEQEELKRIYRQVATDE